MVLPSPNLVHFKGANPVVDLEEGGHWDFGFCTLQTCQGCKMSVVPSLKLSTSSIGRWPNVTRLVAGSSFAPSLLMTLSQRENPLRPNTKSACLSRALQPLCCEAVIFTTPIGKMNIGGVALAGPAHVKPHGWGPSEVGGLQRRGGGGGSPAS
jgi:hypothetical protein